MSEARGASEHEALWAAYRRTVFEARTPLGLIEIRVDQRHEDLDRLLERTGHESWCLITAWNPGSRPLSLEENRRRNALLRDQIVREGRPFHEGIGRGEDPKWAPEESFLVLGVARDEAIELGRSWGQIAVVWGERGKGAELVGCHARSASPSSAKEIW